MKLGKRIRDARRQRRLTLERVAAITRLSVGFLSQVERNITKPSLASLAQIAQALETTVSGLLQESDLPISVSRREGRIAHQIKDEAGCYERLSTSFPNQLLSAVKLFFPSALRSKVFSYDGEMIVYVLNGTVRYVIDGVIYELQSGDSLHFSTSKPHRVTTPADATAEVLVLSTQPVVDDGHRVAQNIHFED
ncbi:XRE family transcriptional regulator [Mesorhizobium sp. BR1-1-16]|uniref:helix-turn-helix domain-containing protein n=1 Tax=Mesorhizobium sp. BR1-1-16 TaxID=2876653 RepID=UPI001CC9CB5F|nr:XRE family transcriptional regulator [Mesorhizobium sp. BR1-1-16]MBZ9937915.1 XRE family transcriptional regulator [Mesorhizobium sp. BR1-1-16]